MTFDEIEERVLVEFGIRRFHTMKYEKVGETPGWSRVAYQAEGTVRGETTLYDCHTYLEDPQDIYTLFGHWNRQKNWHYFN